MSETFGDYEDEAFNLLIMREVAVLLGDIFSTIIRHEHMLKDEIESFLGTQFSAIRDHAEMQTEHCDRKGDKRDGGSGMPMLFFDAD